MIITSTNKIGIIPIDERQMENDTYVNVFSRSTGRVSSVPYPPLSIPEIDSIDESRIIYVSKGGSDETGTGSIDSPFSTVNRAMESITDAAPDRRYEISVGPGRFVEYVSIKANVFVVGAGPVATIIDIIDNLDPSWSTNDDNRSGLKDVQIYSGTNIDFITTKSTTGRFYIAQSRLSEELIFACCSSNNQGFLYNCELLSDLIQVGGYLSLYSSTVLGNTIVYSQSSTYSPVGEDIETRFLASGGGNLVVDDSGFVPEVVFVNQATGPGVQNLIGDLAGFANNGYLVIQGGGSPGDTVVYALSTSIPPPDRVNVSLLGQLILGTYSNSIGYTPTNTTTWQYPQPQTVQEALDRLASAVSGLLGGAIP